jgi:phosphate transport system protein
MISRLAGMALQMLKEALDAFVHRDCSKARSVIPRDHEVDQIYRDLRRDLANSMHERPSSISRCLNLMVVAKSLERIADHAANIAEEVVYMLEGLDIRHRHAAGLAEPSAAAIHS